MLRRTFLAATAVVMMAPAAIAGSVKDIVDTAAEAGSFSTLLAAATAAGLVDTLKSKGPFTVFAPTDEAFAALPAGTVENLLKPENKDQLAAILTYHVVPAKVMSSDIAGKKAKVLTVNGAKASVDARHGVKIDGAKVVAADIVASNGVIHVIDKVIIPGS
ncbi:MAG: fasciclin domain-containing protein [Pseudomonadota bacterium]